MSDMYKYAPPKEKKKRVRRRKQRMTVAVVKETWDKCIVPDEMDCEMIDWLIARCEKLERRILRIRGEQHHG